MYEAEANAKVESSQQLPVEAVSSFGRLRESIIARTVLPWGEHCTECVWPSCYSTCDLYSPRADGRCRRFVEGMVRIDCPGALNKYLLKIRFKRWAKLWAPGNVHLRSIEDADKLERRDYRLGTLLRQLPVPGYLRKAIISKRYAMKKRMALRNGRTGNWPTCFLLECFNPLDTEIGLSITIRSFDPDHKIPFQSLINLKPGFQTVRIPFEEISKILNLDSAFHIELIPNDIGREITLYFGLMEFVQEARTSSPMTATAAPANPKKIKCVVWDLDNTLWDGILVEDGLANIRLKSDVVDIIKELDRRGILHSIASKNNYDEAMRALKHFHIDEFFLCPQISWGPKGAALHAVAAQLNIGEDTLLFVDDSEFELQQVAASCPDVRVLDARRSASILDMDECQVPITAESMERRKMYQAEGIRQHIAHEFKDDYLAFLKHCDIQLHIRSLSEENLERVHELTQRTNQMNFSGNRYTRELLKHILETPDLDTYVLSCEDRFGSYGIIGFGIVDKREPRLTDLMFSCRVQSKRVEHAFLGFLLKKYIHGTGRDFAADYRKTPKNLPSGKVFSEIGMLEVGVVDGVTKLLFPHDGAIPDGEIIRIIAQENIPAQTAEYEYKS
jgi:FkbH-like protein